MTPSEFWQWFSQHNTKYLFYNEVDDQEKEHMLSEIKSQLHSYCDHISFQMGREENYDQELIITAEGDSNYFDKVEELVAAAPPIKDWKIIAFKPALGMDYSVQYNDLIFDPSELFFLPLESEEEPTAVGLRICFPDYDPEREKDFLMGAYLLLDSVLGERQSVTEIDYVEVSPIPEDGDEEDLLPFEWIIKYINWKKRNDFSDDDD